MKEISGEIVGWKLSQPTQAQEEAVVAASDRPHRPEIAPAFAVRVKHPAYGSFIVNLVFNDADQLVEVTVVNSRTSARIQADIASLGRLISMGLKYGAPPSEIIKHLIGQDDGTPAFVRFPGKDKSVVVTSVPDLIGKVIKFYGKMSDAIEAGGKFPTPGPAAAVEVDVAPPSQEAPPPPTTGDIVSACDYGSQSDCPDASWVREAGCETCLTCGFSKCG